MAASMGPRSEGARKAKIRRVTSVSTNWLQWGRARRERGKSAHCSRASSPRPGFNGAALGGSAERAERQTKATKEVSGFNGAALGGSAESRFAVRPCLYHLRLQWGRARRERGKTTAQAVAEAAQDGLQWGRARRERGKDLTERAIRRYLEASMGPRSEGARKVSRLGVAPGLAGGLQWGRARRERGKSTALTRWTTVPTSFNGAALGGSAESGAVATMSR